MGRKITNADQFVESLLNSKLVKVIEVSNDEVCELKQYYIQRFIEKKDVDAYSSEQTCRGLLIEFVNHHVPCDNWCNRLKAIKKLNNTLEKMVLMYGEEKGTEKWNNYVEFHRKKNTFEYKQQKYGITREELYSSNSSRATTLSNMISRHGEELGRQKWDEYCERQRYTTSLEYFCEQYGTTAGTEKYNHYMSTIVKNVHVLNSRTNTKTSKLEDEIFNIISQYYEAESQFVYKNQDNYISAFDIYIEKLNLLIEVNGDFWHMNPKLYESSFINPISKLSAKHKWHLDKVKLGKAKKNGFNIEVIWESDYNSSENKLEYVMEIVRRYEK